MTLEELRIEIDKADKDILAAIEKRMSISRLIAEQKRLSGKATYDPEREKFKIAELKRQAGDESREFIEELYGTILDISKKHQNKPLFGVLGRKLAHTYSPEIHRLFAPEDYIYTIIEREPEELDELFASRKYGGFNVTIPYKLEAAKRCDVLEPDAEQIGSVNTVVFGKDGKTYGYNTDIYGFCYMLKSGGIDPAGKKCLCLGHGGAAVAVEFGLKKLGAGQIVFCDLNDEINYENVYDRCGDAEVIIHATPVGMYPKVDAAVVDLSRFPKVEAFADVTYNPSRSKILQQAQAMGLKTAGGLNMLVAQAYRSSRFFVGDNESADNITAENEAEIKRVVDLLQGRMTNITFIGMPGCGKSTLARAVAGETGREFIDLDDKYTEVYSESPSTTIKEKGEDAFRANETAVAKDVLPQSCKVVSCGGGIVTRDENYFWLRVNSRIIYVKRPLDVLASEDRPITARDGVAKIYEQRRERYEELADITVEVPKMDSQEEFVKEAIRQMREAGVEV